jgi:hypothetical protein
MPFLLMILLLFAVTASAQDTGASPAAADIHPALVASAENGGPAIGDGILFSSSISARPITAASMVMVVSLPKPPVHPFFDHTNLVGIAVHTAIRTADAAQTCALIGGRIKEVWLPMKSCPAIAAYSLSMVPAQIATSYLLHRRGYHRLERWTPYLWAAPSAAGIAVSMRTW